MMAMDMKMKSMKRTPEDKRTDAGGSPSIECLAPDYPYGLCINLDGDELDKLGMKQMPKVAAEMEIHCKVKITRVQQSAVEGSDEERSVSMQITDMAVMPAGD